MFATHYERLIQYLQTFPQVRTLTLLGNRGDGETKEGYHKEEVQSGISVALAAGLPRTLIISAKQNAETLELFNLESRQSRAAVLKRANVRRLAIKVCFHVSFIVSPCRPPQQ